ncbi:major facilitator superfamily domain-containing protein [Kockovaella imperatae]|uniref:Major facilitator superfamily domain-containing protein n=1 Tax=Kockovaella imperatae TaxID=4999 RepID=A0A1Y1UDI1_9TREE|nr:major facilitator superfamily domain-containing protein [Kockovaella imperatae]ORX36039.1 major facilitator superfamily domain-containing protein [Kockovaella imperatae]
MATHETGEAVCKDQDGADQLHTHDEHEDEHGSSSSSHRAGPESDSTHEEEKIGTPSDLKMKKKIELQDQTNILPAKQIILVMGGLSCGLFCSLLDQTIVTTALPTLGRVFNRADISTWVGTAYLLTSTAMQPIYGRLSDIFGRKIILLSSIFVFFCGSLGAALSRSMIMLIVFRAVTGIGGGGILTLTMIIVSDVVTLRERGKYQGILGGVVACSNALGPLLGGIFTESVSWRWCFYINLPLTGFAALIVFFVLPLKRVNGSVVEKLRKLDWYGSVLTLAWAVLVLVALSWAGNKYAWDSAGVLAPLIIGVCLLGVFIYVEARLVPLPLISFRIFKTPTVSACMCTSFFNGVSFYGTLYYLPQYYQIVRGDSAIRSGVLLLPLILTQTVTSFTTGYVQSKTGDYWYNLVMGFSIWTIALGLLSTLGPDTSLGKLIGFQILNGIGAGQTFQTSLMAIQASVARKDMATATGLRNFIRMLGGTLGLAICSVLVNNIARKDLSGSGLSSDEITSILNDPTSRGTLSAAMKQRVIHAYGDPARGIQTCFHFMIPCAGISVLLVVFFVKKVSLKRDDDAQRKAEGKAWVEARKAKKEAKKHHTTLEKIENGVEASGRGMEEAAGVIPPRGEEPIGNSTGEKPANDR